MSNLSAGSATAAAAVASRRTQSPLALSAADSLGQSQMSILGARSPASLAPPTASDQQQRRLSSSSFAAHNNSPSLMLPDAANGGSRPPFGRQSFSDGPSISAANFLSADSGSSSMDARSGSFSGTFPNADSISPLPQHSSSPYDAGLSDPQLANAGATAPTTGPLSASDPRTQLLVSNLPYRVRWQDLKDLFRKAGTVLRADVSLSADNRSRGYGTVLMATEQDAVKAADMLGGYTWQGRTLDVRVDRSGTLVGVAGSAVLPTVAPNGVGGGAAPSPNAFANGAMASNPNALSFDPTAGVQQFLGVPSGSFNGSQGHSPGSLSGAASPSPLSPLARAADYPYSSSSRASFSAHPDAGLAGSNSQPSEFERAMLHSGQGLTSGPGSGNGTPNRQRPGSNFDAGFGGQPQHRAVSAVQSLASSSMSSRRGSDVGSVSGSGSPASAAWTSSMNDAMYSQNAGGSSVPTGFPGAPAMAPWPAGPGAFGGPVTSSMQSQPFGSQMPTTSYAGRVLFVGNLPFHCQWQDLKDLFRAAGNIQRADVAIGPDGRSRGFGTVLFGTQEDAQNAVRLYHGYEYSGRTLKVHFDRFAAQNGPAVGTPGNPAQYTGAFAAAALPSHMTTNVRAAPVPSHLQQQSMQGAFGQQAYPHQSMQHQQQQQQQQQRNNMPMSFGMAQQQGQASFGQTAFQPQYTGSQQFSSLYQPSLQGQQQQQQRYGQLSQQPDQMSSGFSAFADLGRQQSASAFGGLDEARQQGEGGVGSDRRGSTAKPFGLFSESNDGEDKAGSTSTQDDEYEGMSITLPANGFGAASSYLPSDLMSPGLVTPAAPTHNEHQSGSHPGRIQLPSANFANSFGAALAGVAPAGQMSPMTARMQVPMTPGMPGFTFHQVPETPPLYPQFLSPGLDPFSPTASGSAQMGGSETAAAAQNGGDYMNAGGSVPYNVPVALTPGAPIGYNPMFSAAAPGYGGAPGLHQQQQHGQPATPHWSQTSGPRRGGGRGPLRPSMGAHNPEADEMVEGDRAAIAKTPGAGPRRPSHAGVGGSNLDGRRVSNGTPDAVEPSPTDGYPFPLVAAGNLSHLTRRASTNSPAQTPLAGPTGSTNNAKPDSAPINVPVTESLGGTSTEELANTIARLSVKGTALARESSSRRSLSMTAERSAAASAMAKLREKAGTPTPPVDDGNGLGAPFGERSGSAGKSPLSESKGEQVFGLKLSSSALEAARNSSALDSDDGGSRRSTPAE